MFIFKSLISINLPQNLPIVQGQQSLLDQLFLNLVNNALKFRAYEQPLVIDISCEEMEEGWVKIGVSDNGIGIAPKNHDTIFQVFKKIHAAEYYEGSGIGLATCKKIVEGFGGKIWVNSTLGQGSTFYFTLKIC